MRFATRSSSSHATTCTSRDPADNALGVLVEPSPWTDDQVGGAWRYVRGMWDTLYVMFRVTTLSLLFSPLLLLYPATLFSSSATSFWWHLLLNVIQTAGATFIKLAQWAATRRDLFSDEFCDQLSHLHTRTKPHPWWFTRKRFYQAFGSQWKKLFVKMEREPVGSGCVAQVYRAYIPLSKVKDESLAREFLDAEGEVDYGSYIMGFSGIFQKDEDDSPDSGEDLEEELFPVAVKVLHPNIREEVEIDISILRVAARLVSTCFPSTKWLSLVECVDEFDEIMMKQMNLRFEAWSLERFSSFFSGNSRIKFPRPVRPYVRSNILVETWEDGIPLTSLISSDVDIPDPLDKKTLFCDLARLGVDAILQMIFLDNFVHCDLHPGNILVQNYNVDGTSSQTQGQQQHQLILQDVCDTVVVSVECVEPAVQLVFLDAGIITSLSQADLDNFKALFKAVVHRHFERIGELMLEQARYKECTDVAAFTSEIGDVVRKVREQALTLNKVDVTSLLSHIFSILIRHRVKVEPNFSSVILSLFVVEGLGRSLDPELDILDHAKSVLI